MSSALPAASAPTGGDAAEGTGPSRTAASRGPAEERTAWARIRDAGVAQFAAHGAEAATIRSVAEEAGVSPALVIHHFGTKDGLVQACDEYVVAAVRERKHAAVAAGTSLDPVTALREAADGPPLLRYLARALTSDAARLQALVDELVEDAVVQLAEGEANGLFTPSERPRERAVVLTLWSLGVLVLHEQLRRHLDVDLLGDPGALGPYVLAAAEILGSGVLHDGVVDRLRSELATDGGREAS